MLCYSNGTDKNSKISCRIFEFNISLDWLLVGQSKINRKQLRRVQPRWLGYNVFDRHRAQDLLARLIRSLPKVVDNYTNACYVTRQATFMRTHFSTFPIFSTRRNFVWGDFLLSWFRGEIMSGGDFVQGRFCPGRILSWIQHDRPTTHSLRPSMLPPCVSSARWPFPSTNARIDFLLLSIYPSSSSAAAYEITGGVAWAHAGEWVGRCYCCCYCCMHAFIYHRAQESGITVNALRAVKFDLNQSQTQVEWFVEIKYSRTKIRRSYERVVRARTQIGKQYDTRWYGKNSFSCDFKMTRVSGLVCRTERMRDPITGEHGQTTKICVTQFWAVLSIPISISTRHRYKIFTSTI